MAPQYHRMSMLKSIANINTSCARQKIIGSSRDVFNFAYSLWLFTFSDVKTIVLPKTVFGLVTLLSGPTLTIGPQPNTAVILRCLPSVVAWVWINLLPLDLNNQHNADDVEEDRKNKPWRPIPAGRLTMKETRRLMFLSYMFAIIASFHLGGLEECLALIVEGWIYNEKGAANDSYLARNILNATGYMTFASGAAKVASIRSETILNETAHLWIFMLCCVIASTIQFQDLYDQKGDLARGRKTVPLVLGDKTARFSVGIPIAWWSLICPAFWGLQLPGFALPLSIGVVIIFRLWQYRSVKDDKMSFKIWNVWVVTLYLLPCFKPMA